MRGYRTLTSPAVFLHLFLPVVSLHTRAVNNDYLVKLLLQAYLAFEALTDHPYAFSSIVHGFFPLLTSCDGCNKLATNNMTLEKFLAQRQEQVIDMDLSACWLQLSMLSGMVFSKRLQFVYNTPMTFSPHNRKSNIFTLKARGPVANNEDLEKGDSAELGRYLEEVGLGLHDALAVLQLRDLKALYKRCFKGAGFGG